MPELDGLKEQLVYLRLWLGIMVVAEISLIGWFASALETATPRLLSLAIMGIMSLALAIVLLHRRIGVASRRFGAYSVDLVLGIIILAVALLLVGCALDAARDK